MDVVLEFRKMRIFLLPEIRQMKTNSVPKTFCIVSLDSELDTIIFCVSVVQVPVPVIIDYKVDHHPLLDF